ncbi:plasmid stabilization protein [Candidatus Kaiserbacteria bacterium CG10_big_fil_rev_8_21_14_0_10_51_14]|uniref:Plasmid stabilization protein n=1 Tax=Candidatus Kaiserbacteria bacterium CG10_big_fil_rev_8_21_14_0_10_51_14 TaxID=1974610 RepID=A0A2H0UBT6_9BACT|nr:MAG: plasmid stabilization protein [Candidatus Kaiserbacteria bacterium CG10_big_fil_rev_8_21_14_0_10_51_14]
MARRLRIKTTPRFDRRLASFLKAHPELVGKTEAAINSLARTPFDPRNKTHALSGPLKGLWAASISYHYRLVFLLSDDEIILVNIGSHDEVY